MIVGRARIRRSNCGFARARAIPPFSSNLGRITGSRARPPSGTGPARVHKHRPDGGAPPSSAYLRRNLGQSPAGDGSPASPPHNDSRPAPRSAHRRLRELAANITAGPREKSRMPFYDKNSPPRANTRNKLAAASAFGASDAPRPTAPDLRQTTLQAYDGALFRGAAISRPLRPRLTSPLINRFDDLRLRGASSTPPLHHRAGARRSKMVTLASPTYLAPPARINHRPRRSPAHQDHNPPLNRPRHQRTAKPWAVMLRAAPVSMLVPAKPLRAADRGHRRRAALSFGRGALSPRKVTSWPQSGAPRDDLAFAGLSWYLSGLLRRREGGRRPRSSTVGFLENRFTPGRIRGSCPRLGSSGFNHRRSIWHCRRPRRICGRRGSAPSSAGTSTPDGRAWMIRGNKPKPEMPPPSGRRCPELGG